MTRTDRRLLRAAAVPLIGIGLLFGGTGCASKPAAASSSNGGAGGGPQPAAVAGASTGVSVHIDTTGKWKDYDAKGLAWAKCLQAHGLAVTYLGHRDNAENPLAELAGVDYLDKNNPAYESCRAQQPTDSDRPTPFMVFTRSAEDQKKLLVFAKCMREHGFPDYPDPDPDPQHPTPNKYDDLKPGANPAYDTANATCTKQVGFSEANGG